MESAEMRVEVCCACKRTIEVRADDAGSEIFDWSKRVQFYLCVQCQMAVAVQWVGRILK